MAPILNATLGRFTSPAGMSGGALSMHMPKRPKIPGLRPHTILGFADGGQVDDGGAAPVGGIGDPLSALQRAYDNLASASQTKIGGFNSPAAAMGAAMLTAPTPFATQALGQGLQAAAAQQRFNALGAPTQQIQAMDQLSQAAQRQQMTDLLNRRLGLYQGALAGNAPATPSGTGTGGALSGVSAGTLPSAQNAAAPGANAETLYTLGMISLQTGDPKGVDLMRLATQMDPSLAARMAGAKTYAQQAAELPFVGPREAAQQAATLQYAGPIAGARTSATQAAELPFVAPRAAAQAQGQFAGMFGGAPIPGVPPAPAPARVPVVTPSAAPPVAPTQTPAAPQSGAAQQQAEPAAVVVPAVVASAPDSSLPGAPSVNPDVLASMPAAMAANIKGIAEGRIPVSPMMVRTPQGQAILAAVAQYDPTFNAQDYQARARTRQAFTSGPYSQQINALNTTINHAGELVKSASALNNTDYPFLNKALNLAQAQIDPDLKGRLNQFNLNRNAFAEELERAYRGSGGNVTEIEAWKKSLDDADSPVAIKAGIQKGLELLAGKMDALGDTYSKGMGRTANGLQLLSPQAQQTFTSIMGGGQQNPLLPGVTREQIEAEMKRRGLAVPGTKAQ